MTKLEGKIVLVTGASRGLGRAIALAFAREGAHVWVGYRKREKDAVDTVRTIRDGGGAADSLRFDVTDAAEVNAAVQTVVTESGGVDVLVNSAGVVRNNLFALSSPVDWDEPLRVNLGGALQVTRSVVRPMLAAGGGVIVHVGSVSGIRASPGQAGYSASKGGLVAMVRTLAAELGPRGIRVNAVVPGLCSTGMAARLDRRAVDDHISRIPLGRPGTGDEIAQAVMFLASDESRYVVGQALVVDGGLSL